MQIIAKMLIAKMPAIVCHFDSGISICSGDSSANLFSNHGDVWVAEFAL